MKNFLLHFAQKIDAGQVGVPKADADQVLQNGLNIAYFAAGIIAVIVIVVAGIMYASSAGDSANVGKAKNLILYAIVGLVIVLAAWGITNFLFGRF